MDYWDLRIIRAAVLYDLADFIPVNHYANAISGIEKGTADWKLGKELAKANPAKTMRQASATQVLIFLGLYECTSEALAHCEDARCKVPFPLKHPDLEAVHDQLTEYLNSVGRDLSTFMRHYVLHLPTNEAKPLLSLIEKTWGVELPPQSTNQEAKTEKLASELKSPQPAIGAYGIEILTENEEGGTQNIYDLFDPLPRGGIVKLFNRISMDAWREHFKRAAQNGLINARQENGVPICYNPAKVAEWLVGKGYYAQEEVSRKLANNLPQRSKGMKYRITGELD